MTTTVGDILALRARAKNTRAVFFDIDDTLRLKDEKFMPPSIPQVFARLREKNILTGIASGRAAFVFPAEIHALHADFYVELNGQRVSAANGDVIYENPLPKTVVEQFAQWANTEKINYGFCGANRAAVKEFDALVESAMTVIFNKTMMPEEPDFWRENAVYQIWIFSAMESLPALPVNLQSSLRLVRWHDCSHDVVPLTGSKAGGIAQVLAKLQIAPKQTIAFGDELNDLEMLQYAGIGVAMGNARAEVKAQANFVTRDLVDHGIQYALESLLVI